MRNDYLRIGKLSFFSFSMELVISTLHTIFKYLYIPVEWPELSKLPDNPILNIIIIIVLYLGFSIVLVAMAQLGFVPTMGRDKKVLKKNGLYRYLRNPHVFGYSLILFCIMLSFSGCFRVVHLVYCFDPSHYENRRKLFRKILRRRI